MNTKTDEQTLTIMGEPMATKSSKVEIKNLQLNKIKISRNSRTDVRDEELYGLMQSIKEVGLLQPIGVAKNGTGYEICYGNRRFLACSKLGMKSIPVIVHENKRAHDMDLKNLSENVQRRNISLTEIGRYLEILSKDGLSVREVAVRLGVSPNYIKSCQTAWSNVPEKFRKHLEIRTAFDKEAAQARGKISIKAANAITSARKSMRLTPEQTDVLYHAAKSDDRFNVEQVTNYAHAVRSGRKDPIGEVPDVCTVTARWIMKTDDYDRLFAEHVTNGPFKSVSGLAVAILRGEKSVRIKVVK